MSKDQKSSIGKDKSTMAKTPKIEDLAPRQDAKGGGKTLGVGGIATQNGGKTGSGFKVEIEGIAHMGGGSGI